MRTSELYGAEVVNGDEMLGELRDLVVDRKSGRVLCALVEGNGVLGLGDMRVTIPWQDLAWDPIEGRLFASLDQERMLALEIYSPGRLQELSPCAAERGAARPIEAGARRGGEREPDPFASRFAERSPTQIAGEVLAVEHWNHPTAADRHLAVLLRSPIEGHVQVLLGPASFVEERLAAEIVPGDHFAALAVPDREAGGLWIAKRFESAGRRVDLRDDRGRPLWEEIFCVLATELGRARLTAAGECVGLLDSLVIDARSGQLLFATAVRGDELVPIPFGALAIQSESSLVLEGRTAKELDAAPLLISKNTGELSDPTLRAAVYAFYGCAAPAVGAR